MSQVHAAWVQLCLCHVPVSCRPQLIDLGWALEAEASPHYALWVVWLESMSWANLTPTWGGVRKRLSLGVGIVDELDRRLETHHDHQL